MVTAFVHYMIRRALDALNVARLVADALHEAQEMRHDAHESVTFGEW